MCRKVYSYFSNKQACSLILFLEIKLPTSTTKYVIFYLLTYLCICFFLTVIVCMFVITYPNRLLILGRLCNLKTLEIPYLNQICQVNPLSEKVVLSTFKQKSKLWIESDKKRQNSNSKHYWESDASKIWPAEKLKDKITFALESFV